MSKPLEQKRYIQLRTWITPAESASLQRLQEQTGTTRSEGIRGLLSGQFTVTPAPSQADTTEDRHRTI